MARIDSYTKFRDYCLRALGQDDDKLLKVNMTEKQIEDRIEDALKKWQDFHFEGSTQYHKFVYITAEDQRRGYIEVTDLNAVVEIMTPNDSTKSNAEVMDDLDYRFHMEYADTHLFGGGSAMSNREMGLTDWQINKTYLADMRYLFSSNKLFTFNATSNRLYLHGAYPAGLPPQLMEEFREGNWVTGTGTSLTYDIEPLANDKVQGTRIANTDSGANPIDARFTYTTKYYPRGLRTFSIYLKQGTYTGRVKMSVLDRSGTVVKSKTVQPDTYWKAFEIEALYKEGHINDFTFVLESVDAASDTYFCANAPSGYRNNFIILSGYSTADPEDIDTVWDSGWLKAYAIALLKKQWAHNMKKFDGIQMAGGVTLNSQAMYDEAVEEITNLNEELDTKWSMPPAMMIG